MIMLKGSQSLKQSELTLEKYVLQRFILFVHAFVRGVRDKELLEFGTYLENTAEFKLRQFLKYGELTLQN